MRQETASKGFSPFQLWIYDLTRSFAFPLVSALAIIGAACFIGAFIGRTPVTVEAEQMETEPLLPAPITADPEDAEKLFLEAIEDPQRFKEALTALPAAMGIGIPWITYGEVTGKARELLKEIVLSRLTGKQKQVAIAFLWSLYTYPIQVSPELNEIANLEGIPPRYANLVAMWIYQANDLPDEALNALARESLNPDAIQERLARIAELIRAKRWEEVRPLIRDSTLEHSIGPELALQMAVASNAWGEVTKMVTEDQAKAWTNYAHLGLAFVGFSVWFLFLMQQVQRPTWNWNRVVTGLAAAALGVLSVIPTMLAVLWQDVYLGMHETGEPLNDFLYCLFGIGLREESVKLLLTLPLLPILVRASSLEQLVYCGCVGLGFAFQENLQYFDSFDSTVGYRRVLGANFLHMSLTALVGHAFFNIIRHRLAIESLVRFFGVFAGAVALHGIYDLFFLNDRLARIMFMYFPIATFAALSIWFYRNLRTERGPQFDFIAPRTLLAVLLSLLFGCTLISASLELGFVKALLSVASSARELFILVCIVGILSGDVTLEDYMAEKQT